MNALYFSFLIVNIFLVAVISAKEHVPVILWSQTLDLPSIPSLKHLDNAHFSQIIHGLVDEAKPMVIAFVEESISVEDFSSHSANNDRPFPELTKILSKDSVEFLPSVSNPLKAIRLLKDNGYEWTHYHNDVPSALNNPTVLLVSLEAESLDEDRHEVLRSHDENIAHIYGEFTKFYPNSLAIYSGRRSSWVETPASRNRREAAGDDPSTTQIVIRSGDTVIVADEIRYYKAEDGDANGVKLEKLMDVTTSAYNGQTKLTAEFSEPSLKVTFSFTNNEGSLQWDLETIDVSDFSDDTMYAPSLAWAPTNWSYYCSSIEYVNFSGFPKIVMTGFQVQFHVNENNEFGRAVDCTGFFSIAIWSGIIITTMLLLIMSWGIMMLMDINNNDRFDDPKGKTITIAATD